MEYNTKVNMIKSKQIIVGIDIAKHVHYASIIDRSTGSVLTKGIKISNNKASFESFFRQIKRWEKSKLILGMEPTGHYWKVFNNWLVNKGYQTVLVNPHHVKLSKELHNNLNNKNDIKDSVLIATMVKQSNFLNVLTVEETYDELRQFSLLRDMLVKSLSKEKVRLRALLDEFIPEYDSCFKDPSRKTSLKLLESFGLEGLTNNKQKQKKINLIYKTSRCAISKNKANLIVKNLSESIGIKHGIIGVTHKLVILIEQIRYYKKEIGIIEGKLKNFLIQTEEAKYILSIKGIGIVTLSAFLGQTGRIHKFSSAKQLQKFAGMTPVQNKSGKYQGKTKLSKRGNKKFRNVMYRIAVSLISNNIEMKQLYKHKINILNKKKLVALTSIASKALKIMFKLGKDKVVYNANYITIT